MPISKFSFVSNFCIILEMNRFLLEGIVLYIGYHLPRVMDTLNSLLSHFQYHVLISAKNICYCVHMYLDTFHFLISELIYIGYQRCERKEFQVCQSPRIQIACLNVQYISFGFSSVTQRSGTLNRLPGT